MEFQVSILLRPKILGGGGRQLREFSIESSFINLSLLRLWGEKDLNSPSSLPSAEKSTGS